MKKFVALAVLLLLLPTAHAAITGSNGFITANNPANGLTSAAVPGTATQVGGKDGSGNLRALSVDSTGKLNINDISGTIALPAGAATSAKQDTGNTSLSSIDMKTPPLVTGRVPVDGSGVTQPVSVASLPLPSGAATESTLSALNGKVTAVDTGAVVISSSALPTGAATESTLSALNGKIPANLTVTSTRLLTDGSGVTQPVSIATAPVLVAGSAIIGQVGIDQTTPGTTNLVALAANQSVNVAQINGVTPLMGAGNTGTGSARVTIATDQAAVQTKAAKNVTGSGSGAAATVSTVATLTAPANTVGFILMNLDTSSANIRWAVGRTASTTLGQQLQPGRDTGFVPLGADVSIIAESGTQNIDIQWVVQ